MKEQFKASFKEIAPWRKKLLAFFVVLAIAGAVGTIISMTRPEPVAANPIPADVDGAAFTDQQIEHVRIQSKALWEKASPYVMRVGFSFVIGFIAGFAFRQFVKTAATVAAIAGVGFATASYFGFIDLSGLEQNYQSTVDWISGQASGLFDWIKTRVPSTLAGLIGAGVGFLRK